MAIRLKYVALIPVSVLFFSCNNVQTKNHGPIVLGDSSTIVTENDPDKLRDLVTDLKPEIKTSDVKDSIEAAQKAAAHQKEADTAQKLANGSNSAILIYCTNGLSDDVDVVLACTFIVNI